MFLYARVSSKEQAREGYSIEAQQKFLRNYSWGLGWVIEEEYVDVESAKWSSRQQQRKNFKALLERIRLERGRREGKRKIVLLAEKTDRLTRNIFDFSGVESLVEDFGLEVHLPKENLVWNKESRPSDKLVSGINLVIARHYIECLRAEVKKGMLEKAQSGVYPGMAPLGYLNVAGKDGKRCIAVDPTLAPFVQKAFRLYATGKYSVRALSDLLYKEGFCYRKSGKKVYGSGIHSLLKSKTYTGDFVWNENLFRGTHDPIIHPELFEEVQRMLILRGEKKPRKFRYEFTYGHGLLTCGHCGCAITGERKKNRFDSQYTYYHCTGAKDPHCPGKKVVTEETIEAGFKKVLGMIQLDPVVLGWLVDSLKQTALDQKDVHDQQMADFQANYARTEMKLTNLFNMRLEEGVGQDLFERKRKELEEEQTTLLRKMEAFQKANHSFMVEGAQLLALGTEGASMFATSSMEMKRNILDYLVQGATLTGSKLEVEYHQPFNLLAAENAQFAGEKAHGTQVEGGSTNFEFWLGR